jgi:UPF0755 protein
MSASRAIKIISLGFVVLLVVGGIKALGIYSKAYAPSVSISDGKEFYLYIPTGSNYDSVKKTLVEADILKSIKSFEWTAIRKNYPNHVNSGRYLLKHRMSNNELVNLLRSGKQEPVKLTFNNIRTIRHFSGEIAKQLELDSLSLISHLTDTSTLAKYGFNENTISCIFIPNTYEIFWNISPEKFVARMEKEYRHFWNKTRQNKAKKIGMSQEEVISLASIINLETQKNDEKKTIAGVYINRVKMGMRLQADPTVIFALGDFSIRRVLNKHKNIDSPFNTYKYAGIPPGPICLPEISSIDAVLNYEKHNYIYFCAKADFSGYHSFARTLNQHNKNAKAYQRELNKRRIYK